MFGQLRMAHSPKNRKTRGRLVLVGGLAAGAALVLSPLSASAATHQTKTVAELALVQNTALGTILTNSDGFTLYTFSQDKPNKSTCFGVCAKAWPPVLMPSGDKVKALKGVKGIGTIHRGKELQLTFDRKPLYRFAGDTTMGVATGQGVENAWFVVVLKALTTPATTAAPAPAAAGSPAATTTHSSTYSSGGNGGSSGGRSSGASTPTPNSPPATTPTPTSPPATTPPATTPPVVTQTPSPSPPASPSPPSGGGGGGIAY
jgi:predicted lipoprotein with Yx(FWY)xxD motif